MADEIQTTDVSGRFRKRSVVSAEPYRPGLEDGYCLPPHGRRDWCPPPPGHRQHRNSAYAAYIDSLEGRKWISPGDWIITGVRGERYPIRGDIFAETYERVTDE